MYFYIKEILIELTSYKVKTSAWFKLMDQNWFLFSTLIDWNARYGVSSLHITLNLDSCATVRPKSIYWPRAGGFKSAQALRGSSPLCIDLLVSRRRWVPMKRRVENRNWEWKRQLRKWKTAVSCSMPPILPLYVSAICLHLSVVFWNTLDERFFETIYLYNCIVNRIWFIDYIYIYCVCVCACVHACMHACVRACV